MTTDGPNQKIIVAGYGSLLSGYGLLAERRGGSSRLVASEAFPIRLRNARRGLAKPSSHGHYLAMDLEPIERGEPISAAVADGREDRPAAGVGAVGLVFERRWAALIARREEYDSDRFVDLIARADAAGADLGSFLLEIARRTGFDLLSYRRALFQMTGYTSPGYIFHPVPLDDGRVAIAAIGSGFEGSGDDAVQSKRNELGMDRLLGIGEAMEVTSFALDRIGQAGYFAECLLGGMHGIDVGDLLEALEPAPTTDWGSELVRRLMAAAPGEAGRFMAATSLDEAGYRARFGAGVVAGLRAMIGAAQSPAEAGEE